MNEYRLYSDYVGPVLTDNFLYRVKNHFQPIREFALPTTDGTTGDIGGLVALEIDHTEAGQPRAGIDS